MELVKERIFKCGLYNNNSELLINNEGFIILILKIYIYIDKINSGTILSIPMLTLRTDF